MGDFAAVDGIYQQRQLVREHAFEANISAMASAMTGVLAGADMDCEDAYALDSFVAFCALIVGNGLKVTFCPYANQDWWTSALRRVDEAHAGSVVRFNLQCYSGGTGNDPSDWTRAITQRIPEFDITNYVLAPTTADQTPEQVKEALTSYQDESCVGGAFLWTIDTILNDPGPGQEMSDYVVAIEEALNESLEVDCHLEDPSKEGS